MSDHHHGLDRVGNRAQALDQVFRGGAVEIRLDQYLDLLPERRRQALQRLARPAGGRAQHQLRHDALTAQVLAEQLGRAAAAGSQRPVVVRKPRFVPTRLGVSQQVERFHAGIAFELG